MDAKTTKPHISICEKWGLGAHSISLPMLVVEGQCVENFTQFFKIMFLYQINRNLATLILTDKIRIKIKWYYKDKRRDLRFGMKSQMGNGLRWYRGPTI